MLPSVHRTVDLFFEYDRTFTEFPLSETPYISLLDAEQEVLTIYNPGSNVASLDGYYLQDIKHLHHFNFPPETKVLPHSELTVYTCPGGNYQRNFVEPCVKWLNNDGSLRKKEVLNNEYCTMLLYAPNGKCIASCTGGTQGPPIVERRHEELGRLPPIGFPVNIRIIMSIIRIIILLLFLFLIISFLNYFFSFIKLYNILDKNIDNNVEFSNSFINLLKYLPYFYWASFLFDLLSRGEYYDFLECHRIKFILLQRIGDKINIITLYLGTILSLFLFNIYKEFNSNIDISNENNFNILISPSYFPLIVLCFIIEMITLSIYDQVPMESINLRSNIVYNNLRYLSPAVISLINIASEAFLLNNIIGLNGGSYSYSKNSIFFYLISILLSIGSQWSCLAFFIRQAHNISLIISEVSFKIKRLEPYTPYK